MNDIAKTILEQIGGRQFLTMTGANRLAYDHNSLSFRLPMKGKNGANLVRVTLTPADTYTVKFTFVRSLTLRTVGEFTDVYAEDLRGLFESKTGLATSLTRRFAA